MQSRLDWGGRTADNEVVQAYYRDLLACRARYIQPRRLRTRSGSAAMFGARALRVQWPCDDGTLSMIANLADVACAIDARPAGARIYGTHSDHAKALPPWSVSWFLNTAGPTA